MAAIVDTDISINASGDIRWTGAATTNRHTVLEFIQWLMDKQDDEQAAGDDLLDITVDTPFDRSTDQIVTLNSPFNIDDTFATHLYDGSVSQTEPIVGGETLYSGIRIIGPVVASTEYMIIQDGKVLPSFWGTGINPEVAPSLVFSRHLVKSKVAGVQIDGQRITVLARELGDQFRRFPATLGTGNSVAAIGNGADIFNTTSDATIAGWTTISNTEGFQELNIDGTGAAGQEFYSQWNKGDQSINETYERSKWITQRSHTADATGGTPTGADFVIDNATIVGQAQTFIPLSGTEWLTEIRAKIKILAGAPTGPIFCELWDSDDTGSQLSKPVGGILARSEDVLASSITSTYEEVIFRFNRINPATGVDQGASLALANAEYCAVFRHPTGTAGANFSLEGASTDQDSTMNQADDTGAVWTASATDDINITVKSSPPIHGVPGEVFQGINIEVGFDAEPAAQLSENDVVTWGTLVTYDNLDSGAFLPGEYVVFNTPSDAYTGNGTTDLDFATGPDTITRATGSWITDNYVVNDRIHVTGSASNEGIKTVTAVTALVLTVAETLTGELNVAATVERLSAIVSGGIVLYDDGVDELLVSLDSPGASVIVDNDIISTVRGSAETSCKINTTITDEDKGGGTGIILAKDDNGTTGELYLQVLSGVDPVNNTRIRKDDLSGDPLLDYVDATTVLNTKTISPEYLGTSTGSNIIGAYGIGFETLDVGASDRFTSLDDASRIPPNNVKFTVSGLVAGEDRVLVGPRTGTVLDTGQWLVSTALTTNAETALVVSTGTDTVPFPDAEENWPDTGIGTGVNDNARLRIQRDDGIFKRVPYDSHDGTDTFTLGTPVSAAVQINVVASAGTFTRVSGDFLADGFENGCRFTGSGFTNGGNNAAFTAKTVTATVITVVDNTGMVDETGSGDEVLTSNGWDFSTATAGMDNAASGKEAFLAFIDVLADATTETFTGVHTTGNDRALFVRVRDGGTAGDGKPTKTFEANAAQFLSTPQTIAAIRNSDA